MPDFDLVQVAHIERDVLADTLGRAEHVAVRLNHFLCTDDAVPRRAVWVDGEVRDVSFVEEGAVSCALKARRAPTNFIAVASLNMGDPSGAKDAVPGTGSV